MDDRRRIGALGGAAAALSGSMAAMSSHAIETSHFWSGFAIGLGLTLAAAGFVLLLRSRDSSCGLP